MVHSLPVLMNIVSNLLLRSLNVTESIQIWSNPLIQASSSQKITLEPWGEGRASLRGEGEGRNTPQTQGKAGWSCLQGLGGCGRCWHFALQVQKGRKKGLGRRMLCQELKVQWGLEQPSLVEGTGGWDEMIPTVISNPNQHHSMVLWINSLIMGLLEVACSSWSVQSWRGLWERRGPAAGDKCSKKFFSYYLFLT